MLKKERLLLLMMFVLLIPTGTIVHASAHSTSKVNLSNVEPLTYTPTFKALNVKEQMSLSPLFTPDNALAIYANWLSKANTSIDVQNQYITMFNGTTSTTPKDWPSDSNPIVRELVKAHQRGVTVRVQVNELSDSDDVTAFFQNVGISVRWMGDSASATSGSYISQTHNKMVVIDKKVSLISSINFGSNAFTRNREAGMVIQNSNVAKYYTSIFEADWNDGVVPPSPSVTVPPPFVKPVHIDYTGFKSPTNIPRTNYTGIYNVTAFTNPDNANDVIFNYLNTAKKSIYVSMYTISRPDFNNTLIKLKKDNPSLDIQVLISRRRVGGSENVDTKAAAKSLVANLIPVFNSTSDLNFYHNKYWIIDGKHVFVYSGNWSPRSVSSPLASGKTSYPSGDVNRDMGIAIHDDPTIADFFKNEVFKKDVAVASAWKLPIGITQNSFTTGDILSGTVNLKGVLSGLNVSTVEYSLDNKATWNSITASASTFTTSIDTTKLSNGVVSIFLRAVSNGQTFTDNVKVTIANYDKGSNNWRVLLTQVLPNPSTVSDTLGEYFVVSNSFPFDVLLDGWKVGTQNELFTFDNVVIPSYTSLIFARSSTGFKQAFSGDASYSYSFSLSNSGDFVQLLDNKGKVMDAIAWGTAKAPDGSEAVKTIEAGKAIFRSPSYKDTNKATDFKLQTPDPFYKVPKTPLSTGGALNTSTQNPLSFPWVTLFFVITVPIIFRRKNK